MANKQARNSILLIFKEIKMNTELSICIYQKIVT